MDFIYIVSALWILLTTTIFVYCGYAYMRKKHSDLPCTILEAFGLQTSCVDMYYSKLKNEPVNSSDCFFQIMYEIAIIKNDFDMIKRLANFSNPSYRNIMFTAFNNCPNILKYFISTGCRCPPEMVGFAIIKRLDHIAKIILNAHEYTQTECNEYKKYAPKTHHSYIDKKIIEYLKDNIVMQIPSPRTAAAVSTTVQYSMANMIGLRRPA